MDKKDLLDQFFGDPAIVKILKEVMELEVVYEKGRCPSQDALVRYALEESSAEEVIHIRRHASRCVECLRLMIRNGLG